MFGFFFEFFRVGRGHHVALKLRRLCRSYWVRVSCTFIVLVRGARCASNGHLGSPPGGERTNLSAWFVFYATSVKNPTFCLLSHTPHAITPSLTTFPSHTSFIYTLFLSSCQSSNWLARNVFSKKRNKSFHRDILKGEKNFQPRSKRFASRLKIFLSIF